MIFAIFASLGQQNSKRNALFCIARLVSAKNNKNNRIDIKALVK